MTKDQEDRLVMMVQDKGQTWDLSEKDQRAIGAALFELSRLRTAMEEISSRSPDKATRRTALSVLRGPHQVGQ